MNCQYCLLGKTNHCKSDCPKYCQSNTYFLKDRLGFFFPILPDSIDTVTTIYNSKITSIISTDFYSSSYRIDVLEESIDEINSIIQTVVKGKRLEGEQYTNGNLNRIV